MTVKQLTKILSNAGIEVNGVTQTSKIRALILSSNQAIDTRKDFIDFDTTNELIKIKKYKPELAAGRISSNAVFGDSSKTWLKSTGNITIKHKEFTYPIVSKDDILFTVNKETGKIINKYTVVNSARNMVQANKAISYDPKSEFLCYSTAKDFEVMVQNENDYSEFIKYTSITNNTYDTYLDLSQLVGIEFFSERVGNA